jgi:DNA-directed RNA polymerase specialized sigma24 family protein
MTRDADHETARWVIRAQCGDRDAVEYVLRSVQPSLRRYILRVVGATAADDVLQETLISIARKLT